MIQSKLCKRINYFECDVLLLKNAKYSLADTEVLLQQTVPGVKIPWPSFIFLNVNLHYALFSPFTLHHFVL